MFDDLTCLLVNIPSNIIQFLIPLHISRCASTTDDFLKDCPKGSELATRIIINATKPAGLLVPLDDTLSLFV